jgi:fluoroacetyl-CoA thioesterase
MNLEPGATGTAQLTVGDADLATAFSQPPADAFPPVFATARMIALMEVAGSRVLRPLLRDGELSVGVTVDVTHTAPTPKGATVTAEARFTGMDGKLYVFEVRAFDAGGEIGRGVHKRAIIATERLLLGAARRAG